MKKQVFVLLLILFSIFSCNQKEKYQGKWIGNYYHNSSFDEHIPAYFLIEKDSIKFNYGTFNHWHNYKIEIKRDRLVFNGSEMSASIDIDTLTLNNKHQYVKPTNDSLKFFVHETPILDLQLPKLDNVSRLDIDTTSLSFYIYFGKRLDNGEYRLQLNDKYAKVSDLPWFLNPGHHNTYPTVYLFIDKSTPLIFLDQMFDELIKSNSLRIGLINDINLQINDLENIYYDYEILKKSLPAFPLDSEYREKLYHSDFVLGPPPPPSPPNLNIDQSKTDYVFLINNEMFYNKTRINQIQLKDIIEKSIKNNHTIFTLYDLESSYGSFLEMNAIIDNAYKEKREQKSRSTYEKSFTELTKDERREVYLQIPMKHLWSYSIPHYQSILKNRNPIFGDDLKPLDSMLPNKWLDASVNR